MKRTLLYGVLIGAGFLLSACQQQVSTDPVARGDADFHALGCVKCHSIGSEGGTWGPNLTFIGFRKSPQWLDTWLKDPHGWRPQTVMPNFHLPDNVRADLVAYLASQKGQAWSYDQRPWNQPGLSGVARGKVLFNEAGCVACHSKDGQGGYPNNNVMGGHIPALTKVAEGYSKDELETKIREGVPQPASADPSQPAPMVFMPTWGKVLKPDEIDAVADYLISLDPSAGQQSGPNAF